MERIFGSERKDRRGIVALTLMIMLIVAIAPQLVGCQTNLSPTDQLTLVEADINAAMQIYNIWSESQNPEQLQKLIDTWTVLRPVILARLQLYENSTDSVDHARVEEIRKSIDALDAAVTGEPAEVSSAETPADGSAP